MFLGLGAAGRQVVWFKIEQSVMHCSVGTIFDIVTLSFFTFGVLYFLVQFWLSLYFLFKFISHIPSRATYHICHFHFFLLIFQLCFFYYLILFFNYSLLQIVFCLILQMEGFTSGRWYSTLIHFSFLQTAFQSDSLGPFDPGLVDCNSQQVNEFSLSTFTLQSALKKNKFINPLWRQ